MIRALSRVFALKLFQLDRPMQQRELPWNESDPSLVSLAQDDDRGRSPFERHRRADCTVREHLFSAAAMAEVLVRFTETVRAADGVRYQSQACGAVADDGLWEGWIEFSGIDGQVVRTPRETEQPNRDSLVYWAEGLSAAYLEGALRRALDPRTTKPAKFATHLASVFSGPAPASGLAQPVQWHSVLDPFATLAQGEGVLRRQLTALSRDHLVTLIHDYQLGVPDSEYDLNQEALVDRIVRAVKSRSAAT
jgi:hypothetical protein